MKIKITSMDHKGNGIGKIDNKVIFVPKSITGDICDIDIYKSYKKYDIGKINKVIKKSELRKEVLCPYFDICGGCNISDLDYSEQLKFKVDKVKNIFRKYLDLDIQPRVIGSVKEYNYRNKITYHNNNGLGLIGEYDNLVKIDKCLLVSNKVNELYSEIKKNDLSLVKLIMIKECDNGLILVIDGKMDVKTIEKYCISIYMNNKCIYKKEDGYINIEGIKYMVSDKSFFQINTSNISNLYDEIVRYGSFNKNDRVIDLYCGVGSISLYIAKYVKSVLGIEIVDEAIKDAKINAKNNGIDNAKFLCGDVAKLVDDNIDGDILIVDPPRVGLDKHTIDVINEKKIKKMIYVSCDPMTLVRDIKLLDNYELTNISVVDMFPQTHHCESISVLERIKND